MNDFFDTLYRNISTACSLILDYRYIIFVGKTIKNVFEKGIYISTILDVMFLQLLTSLPLVAFAGFAMGALITLQAYIVLADKGMASLTGITLFKAMFYELGPMMTSLIIVAKSGSTSCSSLGHMKQSNQLDALISMGISPISHIVVPSIIGNTLLAPFLCLIHACSGLCSGFFLSTQLGLSFVDLYQQISYNVNIYDIFIGIIVKSIIFGLILSSMSSFFGMKPAKGASGISQNTAEFVMLSFSYILICNFIIDVLVKMIIYPSL